MSNVYFVKVTSDYWLAKNKLQKEAKEFARACERIVLKKSEVQDWIKYFQSGISKINHAHKRCKPLKVIVSFEKSISKDVSVYINGITHLKIYAGKEVGDE